MATGGKRDEIDAKIREWERELERVRVALARAPEPVHHRYYQNFVELYGNKEVVKSRWEAVRGVYQPEAAAVHAFEGALSVMETAWRAAQPMLDEVLKPQAA